jgi:hypothetical protein
MKKPLEESVWSAGKEFVRQQFMGGLESRTCRPSAVRFVFDGSVLGGLTGIVPRSEPRLHVINQTKICSPLAHPSQLAMGRLRVFGMTIV